MKKTSLLALSFIGPFAFLTASASGKSSAAAPKTTVSASSAKVDLAKVFDGKLVDADGKPVKTDNLRKAKYVAVYFSAIWCGPCRQFTPKLVEFAKEHGKDDRIQFVFVSADRSQKDMLKYMTMDKMPWGGVLGGAGKWQGVADGTNGIPHLRVYDAEGKIAIDTDYDGGVGPTTVLAQLKAKLK